MNSRSVPATLSRWPRLRSNLEDLEGAIRTYLLGDLRDAPKILDRNSKVVTLGSCFAANIADALNTLGVEARNVTIGEAINSSYANRYFLDWVMENPDSIADSETLARIDQIMDGDPKAYKGYFEAADVIVYTLGVAPCFFDRQGNFFLAKGSRVSLQSLADDYEFRTTSVTENADNVLATLETVRRLNPDVQIVLSVSPVPLAMTFEYRSAVIADCLSKSTLRVAVEEVRRRAGKGVYYWPSFEIVRWLGAHVDGMYGAEDNSTTRVSDALIQTIMKLFIEVFGDAALILRSRALSD